MNTVFDTKCYQLAVNKCKEILALGRKKAFPGASATSNNICTRSI